MIELLVVLAIIGLIVGLLLPAVQYAREAARRAQCQNNLRQIGIAAQSYHDGKRTLPAAGIVTPAHNWATLVLAELDQPAVHDAYDFRLPFHDPTNATAVATEIPTLLCPSSPGERSNRFAAFGDRAFGACDYWPMTDVDPTTLAAGWVTARGDRWGAMRNDKGLTLEQIHDGTSHTLLMVEDAARPQPWIKGRRRDGQTLPIGWATTNTISPINLDGTTPDGLTLPGPCAVNCNNVHEIYAFHTRGANVGMCDGAVRWLADTTSLELVSRLVTANGAERLQDGW